MDVQKRFFPEKGIKPKRILSEFLQKQPKTESFNTLLNITENTDNCDSIY